jgi:hypothetical protein
MWKVLSPGLLALVLVQAVPPAPAQEAKPDAKAVQELKKENPVPPATGKTDQTSTLDPSAKAPGLSKDTTVMIDGVLAAPGAPAAGETAPAKHSARIAADDTLPIAAYRLRYLTADQWRAIAGQLGRQRRIAPAGGETGGGGATVVGALVPASSLGALAPVPEDLATRFAELRGAGYMRAGGKLVLVDLANMLVIGVVEG